MTNSEIRIKSETRMRTPIHVGLNEALAKGPPPSGNLAVPIFSHGSLLVELYTPIGKDPQKPHTRDEFYFVARGKGFFFDGRQRYGIEPGSFIFVPAGQIHRFENKALAARDEVKLVQIGRAHA